MFQAQNKQIVLLAKVFVNFVSLFKLKSKLAIEINFLEDSVVRKERSLNPRRFSDLQTTAFAPQKRHSMFDR